jgi:hypothetical protein
VKSKQGKEARLLKNIFKTQDIIDKYKVIYDSIKKPHKLVPLKGRFKKGKMVKSSSVKRNRPNLAKLESRLNQSECKSKNSFYGERSDITEMKSE